MHPIKVLRERKGLTQKQFSILTGIPVRTLQNWEGGVNNPPEWLLTMVIYYCTRAF